jgi:hypothetical protein
MMEVDTRCEEMGPVAAGVVPWLKLLAATTGVAPWLKLLAATTGSPAADGPPADAPKREAGRAPPTLPQPAALDARLANNQRWWSGVEWSGVEWSGVEWSGVEWSGVEWSGVLRWLGWVALGCVWFEGVPCDSPEAAAPEPE